MGDAYHGPACPFNLISYRTLMELGFGVQWDRDSIITTSPSGDRLSFEFDNSCGLYVADAVASSPVLVANHFTTEQRKRARMLRELHERLNHASDDQMASLLDLTCLLDTPLTAKDVRISARINGQCKFMNAVTSLNVHPFVIPWTASACGHCIFPGRPIPQPSLFVGCG
jgi:hypothetical protein